MAQAIFESSIKKVYGETASLTTTALHLLYRPNYHEVQFYCASDWRLGIAPKLSSVKLYAASAYTDYTTEATDRVSTTHVPLDGMTTAKTLYMGVTAPTRGFYLNVATNVNAVAATLDMEYLYDVSAAGYQTLVGTVSAALTVGETLTGGTSGATGTVVYDNGTTDVVVKNVSGRFAVGETATGAAQNISAITTVTPTGVGTGYFTDVASDSDGTYTGTETLSQAGLYAFTLPSVVRGALAGVNVEPLYWYRFTPSTTLSTPLDIYDIIPACDTVNYAYMKAGVISQMSLNVAQNGAFEFDHTATDTLSVNWLQH